MYEQVRIKEGMKPKETVCLKNALNLKDESLKALEPTLRYLQGGPHESFVGDSIKEVMFIFDKDLHYETLTAFNLAKSFESKLPDNNVGKYVKGLFYEEMYNIIKGKKRTIPKSVSDEGKFLQVDDKVINRFYYWFKKYEKTLPLVSETLKEMQPSIKVIQEIREERDYLSQLSITNKHLEDAVMCLQNMPKENKKDVLINKLLLLLTNEVVPDFSAAVKKINERVAEHDKIAVNIYKRAEHVGSRLSEDECKCFHELFNEQLRLSTDCGTLFATWSSEEKYLDGSLKRKEQFKAQHRKKIIDQIIDCVSIRGIADMENLKRPST